MPPVSLVPCFTQVCKGFLHCARIEVPMKFGFQIFPAFNRVIQQWWEPWKYWSRQRQRKQLHFQRWFSRSFSQLGQISTNVLHCWYWICPSKFGEAWNSIACGKHYPIIPLWIWLPVRNSSILWFQTKLALHHISHFVHQLIYLLITLTNRLIQDNLGTVFCPPWYPGWGATLKVLNRKHNDNLEGSHHLVVFLDISLDQYLYLSFA